jgi:hypothetical protein
MATPDPLKDAASSPLTDINRLNQLAYGSEGNADIQNINKSLEEQIKSLEDRYAQPNWYKVAAGFAKPQLGGFMASLGSASEAMGENLEQQRSMGIPLAKMRTEMAVNSAILGKNKTVSDEIQAWYKDPKNAGKLPSDQLAADWRARAPDAPAVKSLDTQIGLQQKARGQAQENIKLAQELKRPPPEADLQTTGLNKPPQSSASDEKKLPSAPNDLSKATNGIKFDFGLMPVDDEKMMIPTYAKNIADGQTLAEQKLQTIKNLGDEEHYQQLHNPLDQIINFVEDKSGKGKKMLGNVVNTIQTDSKLQTAALAAINEGVHASFAGNSIQAGAPVQTFLDYYKDPQERAVAQMVIQALIAHNYAKNQIRGGMKGNLPASEAEVITGGGLTNLLNSKTLMHELYQTDNQLDMYHSLYSDIQKIKREHTDVLSSHAPDYQIMNSNWYNNKTKEFSSIAKQISDSYNKSLMGGK